MPEPNTVDQEIVVMDADGANRTQLTNNPASDLAGVFSPDGTMLVFRRDDPGLDPFGSSMFLVQADGAGEVFFASGEAAPTPGDWGRAPQSIAGATYGPEGGTLSTNTGTTEADPIGTSVTTPVAGSITIEEGSTSTTSTGYSLLGQQVEIEAPTATAADPLRIVFRLDRSLLEGIDLESLDVLRDGTAAATCSGETGTASPDPCVASRLRLSGGDAELTVLTSHASAWNFGTRTNQDPDCSAVAPTPVLLWTPDAKFRSVTLAGASDTDGDTLSFAITGVTQDEPLLGLGDKTSPDAKPATSSSQVLLRAERSVRGDGRVYRIHYEVADGHGGRCSAVEIVSVPLARWRPAIDSGATYNSFG